MNTETSPDTTPSACIHGVADVRPLPLREVAHDQTPGILTRVLPGEDKHLAVCAFGSSI